MIFIVIMTMIIDHDHHGHHDHHDHHDRDLTYSRKALDTWVLVQ